MELNTEIKVLREMNYRLNEEIVVKLAEWVEAASKFNEVGKQQSRLKTDEGLKVYEDIRGIADKHDLNLESVERIFITIVNMYIKPLEETADRGSFELG